MTYGIIKKQDGSTYISPIFALKYAGWKSEAIILDDESYVVLSSEEIQEMLEEEREKQYQERQEQNQHK